MKSINTEKIILASGSPRRKELLEQVGINIEISVSTIDEETVSIKKPEDYVKELSFLKAEDTSLLYPESWVLGADTIVVVDNQILGKPQSKPDAIDMLTKLNNREHSVYTGFCLIHQKKRSIIKKCVETKVYFKHLSDQEIQWYVNTGEPFDKAGAYGIQAIGAILVKQIKGSYSNVVGLPVCEVVETLMHLNIIQF
ncbi:Maf family protein [Desulfobacula toluolica]|uniref:dTTP/UTP pyrophosphatase n=1 Tax=Desulfobacula toluolica (strain DSM 7467 / Tol2) TaxID=651182 RepID=K0NKZ9_DESTT|nr:Maf family protein [Desulfobacula toluolica]CCK80603.1 Maf: putative inhibitor of septum formation [Desulfobacula toluolica Tol2]